MFPLSLFKDFTHRNVFSPNKGKVLSKREKCRIKVKGDGGVTRQQSKVKFSFWQSLKYFSSTRYAKFNPPSLCRTFPWCKFILDLQILTITRNILEYIPKIIFCRIHRWSLKLPAFYPDQPTQLQWGQKTNLAQVCRHCDVNKEYDGGVAIKCWKSHFWGTAQQVCMFSLWW